MGHQYRSGGPGSDRSRAVLMRDAALERVGRTRRWVILGAAALTAGFAALVSALAPGRTLSSAKAASSTGASASVGGNATASVGGGSAIPRMPAPANSSDLGLQSPGQAPSPDQSQSQGDPSQSQSPSSQQSAPQPAPTPAPAPVAPPSSGGVVSGGS